MSHEKAWVAKSAATLRPCFDHACREDTKEMKREKIMKLFQLLLLDIAFVDLKLSHKSLHKF